MLDESRRNDVMWLVNTYDELIDRPNSGERDCDLARVQKWLCRVTGMPTVSGAVDAARRLTRHEVSFIAPVRLHRPTSVPGGGKDRTRREEAPEPSRPRPRRPGRRRAASGRLVRGKGVSRDR